jgi:hypothetical protein
VYNLQRKHELEVKGRIRAVQDRHAEQQHQLLRCWRYIDALEHRFAAHSHRWGARRHLAAAAAERRPAAWLCLPRRPPPRGTPLARPRRARPALLQA